MPDNKLSSLLAKHELDSTEKLMSAPMGNISPTPPPPPLHSNGTSAAPSYSAISFVPCGNSVVFLLL